MIVDCILAQAMSLFTQYNERTTMIYCNATVDVIDTPPAHGQGLGKFRVEVYGREPHDYVRIYTINAKSDDAAAKEGLDRFVDDISALLAKKD